ncbi:hypothetical protein K2X89_08590, partial [Myxococcota bacterium]|nr:hypothetical protein [Myxococcota bacterium]
AGLGAFSGFLDRLGLAARQVDAGPAEIEITAFASEGPELPEGLGDTLVECDVAPRSSSESDPSVRGQIRRAEVRLRRSGRDAAGRLRIADDAAWAGALLHELGHALGFEGHVAAGSSILVRDEHALRGRGRAVLRGEPFADATLEALHRLEPGRRLGVRRLRAVDADWVRAIRALDRRYRAAGRERVAVIASVGDREARWSLQYADGARLVLRFPGWPERLRAGGELVVLPDRETLAAIASASAPGRGRSDIGLSR